MNKTMILLTLSTLISGITVFGQAQEKKNQKEPRTWVLDNGVKVQAVNEYADYQQNAISAGYPILEGKKERKIIFKSDDNQNYICTKIYPLKYVVAADIIAYVKNAINRHGVGAVDRINYNPPEGGENEQYLVVTTSWKMMPYVDKMIESLDYNCKPMTTEYFNWAGYSIKKEKRPTRVWGTGITRMNYYPQYRGGESLNKLINDLVKSSSSGAITYDASRNVFFYKDAYSKTVDMTKYLKEFDRPLPQVHLEFKVYEMDESQARELGFDWMAWKNGPAMNLPLFSTGLESLSGATQGIEDAISIPSYSYGGVFFAPQFDASFLKALDDKNRISAKTSGSIMLNHNISAEVVFTPDFQNIIKNKDLIISTGSSGVDQGYTLKINNPTICFNETQSSGARFGKNIIFNMSLTSHAVTSRSNLGAQAVSKNMTNTDMTLEVGVEKLVNTITIEKNITQEHGLPYLSDIPYVKWIFGYKQTNQLKSRYYLTIKATPVPSETKTFKPFTFTED